jgi:hypothetical protein
MDIKQQTQNVANQGRYGDSMLLHVNPAEVKGLAQAMPITVNPETGQPEAFLPFLAPLLGSALGTTFLTGLGGAGVVGAGISSALAAGLGAGAATYLQSGGSGSKALLSGLTAGFGTNALNTGAAASAGATAGTNAATNAATQGLDFAGQTAASQTANAAAQAAYQPQTAFSAGKDMFAGGFDQGAKSLATGLMSPSGMVAGASLGTQGVMNSQELYEQQMRQFEEDEEQRRRDMYANNPEVQLYSASGGTTGFNEGGFVSSVRNLADRLSDDQFGYESSRQVYAPAKTQYQVNPDFMAGFAPETMYFRPNTINSPSMSTLGGSRPTLGADTYTGTKGGYDYEGSVDAGGNYTAGTAQGVQFAPQTSIDPYAAFTGSAPQGLVQSAYNPYPVQPMSMSPIDDTSDYTDAGGIGEDGNEGGGNSGGGGGLYDGDQGYFNDINFMGGDMSGFDPYFSQFVTKKDLPSMIPQVPNDSNFSIENLNLPDFSQFVTQQDLPAFNPQDYRDDFLSIAREGIEMPSYEQPDLSSFAKLSDIPSFDLSGLQQQIGGLENRLGNIPQFDPSQLQEQIAQNQNLIAGIPKFNPQDYRDDFLSIARQGIDIPQYQQPDLSSFMTQADINKAISGINMPSYQQPDLSAYDTRMADLEKTLLSLQQPLMDNSSLMDNSFTPDGPMGRAQGGVTNYANQGQTEIMPMDVMPEASAQTMQDPLIQEVTMFILGESDNEQAVNQFVNKYGVEAFSQLREQILQSLVPGAQTEGLIAGVGNGGMDDDIMGTIGNKEKIAVSQDEFIVPADVVSMLGDGSSDAGSKELYGMMDRVRQKKTGTTKQAPRLANAGGYLPA